MRHAARLQELARGRIVLDVAGRRDVVGGDRVAEQAQHACTVEVRDRADVHRHALEVGRVLDVGRSEEQTSELQSLMRNSYAVFCLKKKNNTIKSKQVIQNTYRRSID